jgi:hypothetical protein
LLRSSEPAELAGSFEQLLEDERARDVTLEAVGYLGRLFAGVDAPGLDLVVEAVAGLEDPAFVRASMRALVSDLL